MLPSPREVEGNPSSAVLVATSDVLHVAERLLSLAFGPVRHALRLLLAVTGHRADLGARLAADVLQVALGLVSGHVHLQLRTMVSATGPALRVPGHPRGLVQLSDQARQQLDDGLPKRSCAKTFPRDASPFTDICALRAGMKVL